MGRACGRGGSQRDCDAVCGLRERIKTKNSATRAGTIDARMGWIGSYANARFMVAAHIGVPEVVVSGMPWPSAVRFGSPSM